MICCKVWLTGKLIHVEILAYKHLKLQPRTIYYNKSYLSLYMIVSIIVVQELTSHTRLTWKKIAMKFFIVKLFKLMQLFLLVVLNYAVARTSYSNKIYKMDEGNIFFKYFRYITSKNERYRIIFLVYVYILLLYKIVIF